jgi:hypothetical protein
VEITKDTRHFSGTIRYGLGRSIKNQYFDEFNSLGCHYYYPP